MTELEKAKAEVARFEAENAPTTITKSEYDRSTSAIKKVADISNGLGMYRYESAAGGGYRSRSIDAILQRLENLEAETFPTIKVNHPRDETYWGVAPKTAALLGAVHPLAKPDDASRDDAELSDSNIKSRTFDLASLDSKDGKKLTGIGPIICEIEALKAENQSLKIDHTRKIDCIMADTEALINRRDDQIAGLKAENKALKDNLELIRITNNARRS